MAMIRMKALRQNAIEGSVQKLSRYLDQDEKLTAGAVTGPGRLQKMAKQRKRPNPAVTGVEGEGYASKLRADRPLRA